MKTLSRHPDQAADEGRVNQRKRTQRALLDAAAALCGEGKSPTFAEIAERAMVSRATAYRYFSSAEALISEALFERAVPDPQEGLREGEDPQAMLARAAGQFNALLVQDERALHVMERSFMSVWLDNDPASRPPRPGRRLRHIEPAVDALAGELSPQQRRRLTLALCMVMGPEAVVSLRDVGGAGVDEVARVASWAAATLVGQARAEASAARAKRKR